MNIRLVIRQLGLLLLLLCLAMLAASAWEAIERLTVEGDTWASVVDARGLHAAWAAAGIGAAAGGLLWLIGWSQRPQIPGRREALLLVALSWLLGAAVAALPYFLWARFNPAAGPDHPFASYVACYFESISGLTTTGATVLSDIETLPRCLLLWRAATHWLGGLGIVVLFVAVLPMLGVGGRKLVQAEVPGPRDQGLRPRIREAARIVLIIYLSLNLAEIISLRIAGLSWFDSVCESFGTIATGGFSTRNASVAGYRSLAVEVIITVFMLLSGVNFALYYGLLRRGVRQTLGDVELRAYLVITVAAVALVVIWIASRPVVTSTGEVLDASLGHAVRYGAFQVVSIRTNTGFATADVNPWGILPHIILVLFMFTGASAGSTAGGVKLIRCIIAVKLLAAAVEKAFRPNVVRPLRLGRQLLEQERGHEAVIYILLYLIVWFTGAMAVLLIEPQDSVDLTTALTASAACLSNTGPGLGAVGTVQNFGWMTESSKIILSIVMLLGRLEMYAILVLFVPRFWRNE